MTWALGEVEALARKAARGGGLPWGMAEEAGRAVRWLAGVALPGPGALVRRLDRGPCAAPDISGGLWGAATGPLCPLAAGAALSDRAAALARGPELVLRQVAEPLLLVPFVAGMAARTGVALRLDWPGGAFAFGTDVRGAIGPQAGPVDVGLRSGAGDDLPLLTCRLRYQLPPGAEERLTGYTRLTYAPETEASRLSGAGAGLSDND